MDKNAAMALVPTYTASFWAEKGNQLDTAFIAELGPTSVKYSKYADIRTPTTKHSSSLVLRRFALASAYLTLTQHLYWDQGPGLSTTPRARLPRPKAIQQTTTPRCLEGGKLSLGKSDKSITKALGPDPSTTQVSITKTPLRSSLMRKRFIYISLQYIVRHATVSPKSPPQCWDLGYSLHWLPPCIKDISVCICPTISSNYRRSFGC